MRKQKHMKVSREGIISETPQNLTTGWVIYGSTINVVDFNMITLWLQFDINDGANMQFQVRITREQGGTEYLLPIYTIDSGVVKWRDQYYEYDVDQDVNVCERFAISEATEVKLYVQAGTVGATACQIDSAYYHLSTAVA